ncbi:MAG: hypothetical protein JRI22_11185 [Deltaproteobacteria bacterium]|nr:hypothetical protein [Deltaproteobacteria bacterium]
MMQGGKIFVLIITTGVVSLFFLFSSFVRASERPSQCIQCHTSKEKLQAIAKTIPKKYKSAEAEGTG